MNEDLKYVNQTQVDEHDKPSKTKKVLLYGYDPDSLQVIRLAVSPDGFLLTNNPLSAYVITDKDTSTSTKYYGFLQANGAWYIQRITATESRFARGSSNYSTNWTNRASHSYQYFDSVF